MQFFNLVSSGKESNEALNMEKSTLATAAFFQSTIKSAQVVIFSKTYCPYSSNAKRLFAKLGKPFKAIELDQLG